MIESQTTRRRIGNLITHAVLAGLLVIFLGPFFWLLSTSFKTEKMMFKLPPQWVPRPVTLEHYRQAFTEFPAVRYTINTLTIVAFTTVGTLLSCSMAAA